MRFQTRSGRERWSASASETGHAVGDALSAANRWEIAQKGSQENAFVTLGYSGSRLVYEIAVYEFKLGREKPLIIAVRSRRGLFSALSGMAGPITSAIRRTERPDRRNRARPRTSVQPRYALPKA